MYNPTHDFASVEFQNRVFAAFPSNLHKAVEEVLFYRGDELEAGKMTEAEFASLVTSIAEHRQEQVEKAGKDQQLFEGVRQLVQQKKISDAQLVEELNQELAQGSESLLARFISLQTLSSPLDAVISFLAWKRTKALFDLEETFGVSLQSFRDLREPELFCTSEGNMALVNFSGVEQRYPRCWLALQSLDFEVVIEAHCHQLHGAKRQQVL